MVLLLENEPLIRRYVEKGETYSMISQRLKNMHPRMCGVSERSVRRFCKQRNIHSMIDSIIAAAATEERQCKVLFIVKVPELDKRELVNLCSTVCNESAQR